MSKKMKINKLQLLDDHIQVLCKKIENLSDELKQVVHERDILVDQLGIITWPYDDFLTNGDFNHISLAANSASFSTNNTQSFNNTLNQRSDGQEELKKEEMISFDANRDKEEAFDRDLPTPRGVFMSDRTAGWHSATDVLPETTGTVMNEDEQVEKVIENEDNCSMIGEIISDINSPNFDTFEEQQLKPTIDDSTLDELNLGTIFITFYT